MRETCCEFFSQFEGFKHQIDGLFGEIEVAFDALQEEARRAEGQYLALHAQFARVIQQNEDMREEIRNLKNVVGREKAVSELPE